MNFSFRTLAVAATLAAALAPTALAGGMSATVQGPARDGITYTVLTNSCAGSESMRPSGWAEGVVKGERQTLPLTILPGKSPGGYYFQRTWPADGRWLVRLTFGNANAPALVAQIGRNGRVGDSKFVWNSDGKRECDTKLAVATR